VKNRLNDDKLISQYLLGDLSEEDQAQLEEQFFNDDEYFDSMLAIEDELIDDYVQGELSPRQRELFEKHFLGSPERRSRVEFAQALQISAAQATTAQTARAISETQSKSRWQSLLALFGLQNPTLQFALAAAAVVLMLGCSWLIFESARLRNQLAQVEAARSQQEKEAAEQSAEQRAHNERLASDLERERNQREEFERALAQQRESREKASPAQGGPTRSASFLLWAGLLRDEQGIKRLSIPQSAEQVRLQLNLRRPGEYKSYRAALKTIEGETLLALRANQAGSGKAVVVSLSAELLKQGDYKLTLSGLTDAGNVEEIDNYYFSVVKK
jgi:hypothetical protein